MWNRIQAISPFFPAFDPLFLRDKNRKTHGFFSRKNRCSSGLCSFRGFRPAIASGEFPNRSRILRSTQYGRATHDQGMAMVVKKYARPTLFNCFVYTFFRPSKAERAYRYALRLARCGVETAAPIGYVHVYRGGIFHTGYFLCRFLPYPTLSSIKKLDETEKRQLGEDFVAFTVFLHRHGLVPGDYNPGNILYHKDSEGKYRFALVDINRFYFGHPTMARCMRSFTQLSGARLSQLVVLIRRYCDVRHWDPKRAWKYFQLYRRSLCRKERIKSKFKSLLGLLP